MAVTKHARFDTATNRLLPDTADITLPDAAPSKADFEQTSGMAG